MKTEIKKKRNRSLSGLNMLTYPIFKYERKTAAEMLSNIVQMILKTEKCLRE
jgi:hypothetical protein